jgi:hypothetical protein
MATRVRLLVAAFVCSMAFRAIAESQNSGPAKPPGPEQVAALRERGPEGLAEALRACDHLQAEQRQRMFSCFVQPELSPDRGNDELKAWTAAIDQIGAQRGCMVSRLYWYTDLGAAKAEAERTDRPILSLRMLGKLTDEFSCANSRFFRTALYSNKEISDYLRDNFVLHWQSVRPVPRVTIDFGDGRKLERTVTGNSAHYVLASDGTPLDALPGLYSPKEFLSWLRTMHDVNESYSFASRAEGEPESRHAEMLKTFHRNGVNAILRTWDRDIRRLGKKQADLVSSRIDRAVESARVAGQPAPKARAAAQRAVTKSVVELPLLRFANLSGPWIEKGMDDDLWQAVANLHRANVQLDDSSVAVMRQEFPRAAVAGQQAATKRQVEDPVLRMVRNFEDSMSLDTVRNEYLLHRRIHERLAESETGAMDFDALNEWVYADLFLTPSKDPWLGMAPSDIYTALENDGHTEIGK